MAASAAVYLARPLDVARIRSAARGARVSSGPDQVLAVVDVGGARVTVKQLAADEVAAHVAGVRNFVTAQCDVDDDAVFAHLDAVQQVLALMIEPALDGPGKAAELIQLLARHGLGVAFDGERFRDSAGHQLAARKASSDPADPGAAAAASAVAPTAERVLYRAWALAAVADRTLAEAEPAAITIDRSARIRTWLVARGADPELEPDERAVLEAPIGGLAGPAATASAERAEGLAVLGWALGLGELPDHQTPVDARALAGPLGLLADPRPEAVDPPRLRSTRELEWLSRRLIAVHWRLRELATHREPIDFRSFADNAWFGSFDLVGLTLVDDDLALDRVAVTRAERARVKQCLAIAAARHQAVGWLRGLHLIYSRTPTTP